MMRKVTVFFVFMLTFFNAQKQRFTYEYKFIPDSTQVTDVKSELMVLDVLPKGSRFYSYEKFKSDSLTKADLEKQISMKSQTIHLKHKYKGRIFYTVSKEYPSFKTYLHTKVGPAAYKVWDARAIVWKILPVKEKTGDFETQRAETEMFGRTWTAWFTTEIPVQDGPYKFRGLPGLIVKLEDTTGSHSFELKGISKIKEEKTAAHVSGNKEIEIDHARYKKLILEERQDPTKGIRMMLAQSSESLKMFDDSGKELSSAEIIKKREENVKENRRKNNNHLELDIAK